MVCYCRQQIQRRIKGLRVGAKCKKPIKTTTMSKRITNEAPEKLKLLTPDGRLLTRFNLVRETGNDVVFYFEKHTPYEN
jgi:hypothetical protein